MNTRHRPLLLAAASLGLAFSGPLSAALFPQSFSEHALCCGPRGAVGLDGFASGGVSFAPDTLTAASGAATGVVATPEVKPVSAPATAAMPAMPDAAAVPAVPPTAGAAPVPGAVAMPTTPPEKVGDYLKVGFDRLAGYKFTPPAYDPAATPNTPPPSAADQIPDSVKKFDGQKAIVTGFMLPVKMDNGLVTEFLLVSNPMLCCYGAVPQMNEWVVVKMAKGGVKPLMDVPVEFYGKLSVKEMYENGYMTGIYMLEGEKMGAVQG